MYVITTYIYKYVDTNEFVLTEKFCIPKNSYQPQMQTPTEKEIYKYMQMQKFRSPKNKVENVEGQTNQQMYQKSLF